MSEPPQKLVKYVPKRRPAPDPPPVEVTAELVPDLSWAATQQPCPKSRKPSEKRPTALAVIEPEPPEQADATEIVVARSPSPLAVARLAELSAVADALEEASRAPSTRSTYRRAFAAFARWCESYGVESFPALPETIRAYIGELAGRGVGTSRINVIMAAIRAAHFDGNEATPTGHPSVKRALSGDRRTRGAPPKKKAALSPAQLHTLCEKIGNERPIDLRDRALITLGFAGAFRREALVALQVEDVTFVEGEGAIVFIRKDKTDPERKGRKVAIAFGDHDATCPILALIAWTSLLGSSGPLFVPVVHGVIDLFNAITPQMVALILKRRALQAGLSKESIVRLAGHSLRSGFATAAAKGKKRLDRIMAQTGHVKTDTVLGYIRDAELFDNENASKGIGL